MVSENRSGSQDHESPRNEGTSPLDPCWQEGIHSLVWPLFPKTTLASGFPSKRLLSAGCWCTCVPGEHTISTPSGRHLAASGTEGKPKYKWLTGRQITAPGLAGARPLSLVQALPWGIGGCCTRKSSRNTGFWIRLDLVVSLLILGEFVLLNLSFLICKVEMIACNSWRGLWT